MVKKKKKSQFFTYLAFLHILNSYSKILWSHKVYQDFTRYINLQVYHMCGISHSNGKSVV